jgi:hypothetical protein
MPTDVASERCVGVGRRKATATDAYCASSSSCASYTRDDEVTTVNLPDREPMPKKLISICVLVLYFFAALQFTRYYSKSTIPYLNMQAYLSGHERLPFQDRVLPILFLGPLSHSAWVHRYLYHEQGAFTAERGPAYLLSLLALLVTGIYAQRLYALLTESGVLRLLVFPLLLFTAMWSYTVHLEADYSYPYDLPSLAFFTAGLFYIYNRRFFPLLLIIFIGTFNRETTLFLIGIFVLDAITRDDPAAGFPFDLRRIPWARTLLLFSIWLAIKLGLAHHFAANDTSESFLRVHYNLRELRPRLVPALLNICGYVLPVVLLFSRGLRPVRFRNYLWILPGWMVVMFCAGVLLETRIYAEWCSYSAIAAVLLLERHATLYLRAVPAHAGSPDGVVSRLPQHALAYDAFDRSSAAHSYSGPIPDGEYATHPSEAA